jgi:hypothetical protein
MPGRRPLEQAFGAPVRRSGHLQIGFHWYWHVCEETTGQDLIELGPHDQGNSMATAEF